MLDLAYLILGGALVLIVAAYIQRANEATRRPRRSKSRRFDGGLLDVVKGGK